MYDVMMVDKVFCKVLSVDGCSGRCIMVKLVSRICLSQRVIVINLPPSG